MPELDRLEKSFRPGWIRPYRVAGSETASEGETSDAIITALYQTLRTLDGVPGLEELADVIASPSGRSEWAQFAAVEEILQLHGGHRHTELAAQAAKSMLVEQAAGNGLPSGRSLVKELATRTCQGILDHYFFAIARDNLIAQGVHADHVSARHWQSRVEGLLDDRIERTAEKLINTPHAAGLRAPNRSVPRRPTEDLLHDNLLAPEPDPVAPPATGRDQ